MIRDRLAAALPSVLALALASVAGGAVIAVAGQNPLVVYAELIAGTLGSGYGIGQMLAKATPLLFTGLSVALAFRGGLFNVGAEGQMIVGGLAAGLAGVALAGWPAWVLVPVLLVTAAAGGAATAAIPAWLKAARGVHEVIATIMLNFIAAALAGAVMARAAVHATVHTAALPESARLPRLSALAYGAGMEPLGDALRASPANAALFLGLLAALAVRLVLRRTVAGFELRVTGRNARAAANAGIHVPRVTAGTLLASGALAGLAGTSFVLGHKYFYETGFAGGAGFMGIAVALVGRNHPGGVVAAALLFGLLSHGGLVVNARVSSEIVNVLQALIVLFLIAAAARLPKPRTAASPIAPSPDPPAAATEGI